MSICRTNPTAQNINRGNSIPNNKKKVKTNPVQAKRVQNKDSKLIAKKRNIKVDYNSNNCFYNDEEYEDYPYNKAEYYDKNQRDLKYNNETSDSYITVEQEDGYIKYMPKKHYVEYKGTSPILYNNKNMDFFEENSDLENNDEENANDYYENEDEYEQDIMNNQSPINSYKNYNKIYITHENSNANNNKIKKINQNVITRPINHQINITKDLKRKGRTPAGNLHNCGNNTTTTNNTYNNNIYYINPINVKNKKNSKKEDNVNKLKRNNTNKKNSVYKNVDITISKKKPPKERDYFKKHNIDRSQREKYINAAILIQSIFRAFLIKVKLYNNINLYISYKKSVDILEYVILNRKRMLWKLFQNSISHLIDIINSKLSLNILKDYLKINKNNTKEKKIVSFHKELGDSFNIIIDNKQKELNEKKLKSQLNDVMKENTELKHQLVDNKNIEEKMKNLIDENKKNQNINAIIMKDNQQLAKKIKDMQDYRNINLIVENQSTIDLTQIEELKKYNDIYYNKIKEIYLGKIINKKINENKYNLLHYFNKYKNIVNKINYQNYKNNEKKVLKELHLKKILDKIVYKFKLLKQRFFLKLYYNNIISNEKIESRNNLKKSSLKKIINNKERDKKNILYKAFFKYYYNTIKLNKENNKKEEEEDIESSKINILKKIVKRYLKNTKLIFKIFLEKWNLKAKIIGMRAAARDKKKKRKLKKKNNRLIYQKHFGIADKKDNPRSLGPKFCKSIHEFSYIVSNGAVIKESSSSELTEMKAKNVSCDKKGIEKNKNLEIKKINSANVLVTQEKFKKDKKEDNKENENANNNEESDEDSGDSLGLDDNNSD